MSKRQLERLDGSQFLGQCPGAGTSHGFSKTVTALVSHTAQTTQPHHVRLGDSMNVSVSRDGWGMRGELANPRHVRVSGAWSVSRNGWGM